MHEYARPCVPQLFVLLRKEPLSFITVIIITIFKHARKLLPRQSRCEERWPVKSTARPFPIPRRNGLGETLARRSLEAGERGRRSRRLLGSSSGFRLLAPLPLLRFDAADYDEYLYRYV